MLGPSRFLSALILSALFCVCASPGLITVQFAGQVSGGTIPAFKEGSWVTGCFTYDTNAPDRTQSGSEVIFSFSIPEQQTKFQRTLYALGIFNNWAMGTEPQIDGVILEFSYPGGYGAFGARSSDLSLFPDASLPAIMPSWDKFDLGSSIYIAIEEVQPYLTTAIRIDHFRNYIPDLPGPKMTCQIIGQEVQLELNGDPVSNYLIEATDSLLSNTWTPVAEVAGIAGNFKVSREFPGHRFFRLKQLPCECFP